MADVRRFLRDNLVFVAAFALPGAVAALFLLATAIPNWTVPLPQHDLVLRIDHYGSPTPEVIVDFAVREGRLEATVRPVPPPNPAVGVPYVQRWALLLFDRKAMEVREIPLALPQSLPAGETRTVVIDALAGRHVLIGETSPDGYKVASLNTGGGGGIVGEVFGMGRRSRRGVAIARDGRTIELDLPVPYRDSFGTIVPIGWIRDERQP